MWSVQDLLDFMKTPAYEAAVEASRREKEKAEDDYFDQLGKIVEDHPVGRPISRFAPLAEQPKAGITASPEAKRIWQAVKHMCERTPL